MHGRMKQVLISGGAIILIFLAGFVPEHLRANRFEKLMQDTKIQTEFCRVRDLGGLTFLQTSLKNYGLAARYSTEFFDTAKALAASTESAELRDTLQAVLSKRDIVTAQLARGDQAAYDSVQSVYATLVEKAAVATWERRGRPR